MTYRRSAAVAYATAQLGKPYQWGGTGQPGWDCSGLTKYAVHAGGGPELPHQSSMQVVAPGVRQVRYSVAARGALLPGDLVFWYGSIDNPPSVSHCALYTGTRRVTGIGLTWQCVAAVDDAHGVMAHRLGWALRPCGFGYIGH